MITYNEIKVPETIRTNRIISAFENYMDADKIETYTEVMRSEMLGHNFPPITGHPHIISEDDLGEYFLDGNEITEEHMGNLVWYVTDGHHRSVAAINAEIPYLEVEMDFSTFTTERDMINYRNHYK